MIRSLMQVSGFTAISRVLGFVRDIFIAKYLGTGLLGDAFFSAFRFPNLFRRIFGEGAFNAAFVPMFGKRLQKEGKEEAMKFASNAFSSLLLVLVILMLAAIPCMHWIMGVVVPGFKAKVECNIADAPKEGLTIPFSMRVDGRDDIYFTFPRVQDDETQQLYALKNLRFVEGVPRGLLSFIWPDQRGDEVPVDRVVADYEQWYKDKDGENEARIGVVDLTESAEGWYVTGSGTGQIRLLNGHNYGWFEGEIVVATEASQLANDKGSSLKIYRNHPDTFNLTVRLSQITFSYLLFMALVAHLSGVLNTFKIFGIPAAAPIILNIVFLLGMGIFVAWMHSEVPAHVLAWCVAIAGLLQFMMLYAACQKNGYHIKVQKPVLDGSIKKLFLLMGRGVLAAGIQQINLLVGSVIASFEQGAISWLYYSDRVYQLPLGMIGIALGVVLLPEVTRLLRSDDAKGASDSMVRGMELGLVITLPAAVAMIVIPEPIITVLFQRGEFSAEDAYKTGMALRGFALGLPGYVLIKVLQPGFFARENTRSPMMMAAVTVVVNIVMSLLLFGPLGHVGIAIATTIAAWVNVVLLAIGLKGMVHVDRSFWVKILRMVMASVVMGVLVWLLYQGLASWFMGEFWLKCIVLGVLIVFGIFSYGVLALLMRVTSVAEMRAGFRRG